MFKIGKYVIGGAIAVLVGMQFVQPVRTNPPSDPGASFEAVVRPPAEVAKTLRRACGDCHSNQTAWPWYSRLAPVSWFIVQDVNEGRAHLNLSDWNRPGPEGEAPGFNEVCEEVRGGKMPPSSYTFLHKNARLTQGEVATVCAQAQAER